MWNVAGIVDHRQPGLRHKFQQFVAELQRYCLIYAHRSNQLVQLVGKKLDGVRGGKLKEFSDSLECQLLTFLFLMRCYDNVIRRDRLQLCFKSMLPGMYCCL